ncbi:MAG: EamA family transporter [Ktedonobacterales bacterium]
MRLSAKPSATPSTRSSRMRLSSEQLRIVLALLAVYLIWGSTYLAIGFAVKTLPPFLMAGARFLVAGIILYVWMRLRGTPRPSRANWLAALVVGGLLLVGGNGGVVWAEQFVPSSQVALLISITPIWMVLLDWLRPHGVRPSLPTLLGLAVGFVGVALLIGPNALADAHSVSLFGLLIVPLAALSWAAGSVYSRGARMPASPFMGTALEMLVGGALLLGAGVASGEPGRLHLASVSLTSALALLYLILFGSLVGFTAYVWLLRKAPLAQVSTYAYVNPAVAVVLGVVFDGERLTTLTLVAAAIIIGAVVVITTFRPHPTSTVETQTETQPTPAQGDVAPELASSAGASK